MKKSVFSSLLLASSLLLTGCFGGGSEQIDVGSSIQTFQNFQIAVPSNWQKIFQEDFANTIPDETVALFLNRVEGSDFIQNVNVVKESLNTDASSLEYAKANILLGSRALVDYRPINTSESNINEVTTVIHTFRARNETTAPLRHYTQSYFSRNNLGYTVTCIALEDDISQQENCSNIIQSFQFL